MSTQPMSEEDAACARELVRRRSKIDAFTKRADKKAASIELSIVLGGWSAVVGATIGALVLARDFMHLGTPLPSSVLLSVVGVAVVLMALVSRWAVRSRTAYKDAADERLRCELDATVPGSEKETGANVRFGQRYIPTTN